MTETVHVQQNLQIQTVHPGGYIIVTVCMHRSSSFRDFNVVMSDPSSHHKKTCCSQLHVVKDFWGPSHQTDFDGTKTSIY